MIREVLELLFGRTNLRVQFLEVLVVELSRDGFVDILGHGVIPEPRIFLHGIKTSNLSGASDSVRSVNHTETSTWTYNVYPTPRGSQEIKSKAP